MSGLAPRELFGGPSLLTLEGFVAMVVGGFLVGFGTAYAGRLHLGPCDCRPGRRQLASLLAVCGFFAGGLAGTHVLLPLLLR